MAEDELFGDENKVEEKKTVKKTVKKAKSKVEKKDNAKDKVILDLKSEIAELKKEFGDVIAASRSTAAKEAKKNAELNVEETKEYKDSMRRYRCKINSTRKEVQVFELTYPHPNNRNKPVRIDGKCGVILEKGLPMYVIQCLEGSYHTETTEVQGPDGISRTKNVKIPNFQATIYEEIENPEYPSMHKKEAEE